MKTRLRLIADHMSAVAICDGIKYTYEGMIQLKSDKIADYLLEQGWRPPMQKISTIEELESLPVWTELLDADYGLIQKVDSPYGTFIRTGSMAYWSAHDIVNCGPFLVQWEPECES